MDRRRFVVAVAAAAPAAFSAKLTRAQDTDAEFQQYIGAITAIMNMLGWFFDEVGTLTSNSTEADYVDEEWRLDVLGPFSIASAAQEVIATLDAPSLLAEAHGYLAESVDHLVIADEYMRDGVLNLNVESINLAVESMLRANDLINQASDAMPELSTSSSEASVPEQIVIDDPISAFGCEPSYPDVCIPPSPPDLDCGDVGASLFTVLPPDPHRFDPDFDGIGCETAS